MQREACVLAVLMTWSTVWCSSVSGDGPRDNQAQNVRRIPEAGIEIPGEQASRLKQELETLQNQLKELNSHSDPRVQRLLPDVMIFERAVRCALDYNEFFDLKEIEKADALLAEGKLRAEKLAAGDAYWTRQTGLVVRGYISRLDKTVQPYGLVIPENYAIDHSVPTRCDLWFHGRGEKLSEVNFLFDRMRNRGEFTPERTIVLHPYGRYCNAFKFAGEVDVLEALEDTRKKYNVDENRVSVRGFSMGGAACWQFATHYSDRWFAAAPGAGFSETPQFLKVFQNEELRPTTWEQKLWNLYDCDKYAINLMHCPTIAYSGEKDRQKQAADVMEAALRDQGVRLNHVIGVGMDHRYDAQSKERLNAAMDSLALAGRDRAPSSVQLTTYTLKYNRMHWVTIEGLEEHWRRATIQADVVQDGLQVKTTNVTEFNVEFPAGTAPFSVQRANCVVTIQSAEQHTGDQQIGDQAWSVTVPGPLSDRSWSLRFRMEKGQWVQADVSTDELRKKPGLQGPIDDALMNTFVFVTPTGEPLNDTVGRWVMSEQDRAIEHWRRHFRGDVRIIKDTELTDELIQSANLILWGDPSSNRIMERISEKLPVRWTAETITVGTQVFSSQDHAPILIYPNPLNPNRYVVLNSSFTFRDYAYLNNARQVPMLPDWAVIDLKEAPGNVWPGRVAAADFFDESWWVKPFASP